MSEKVLVPSYYEKFACLGGGCRYTCCQEWPITISKRDYKELMKARVSHELQEKLHQFAGKIKDETFDEKQNYAHLRMSEDGTCPFLTGEGFCGLQIECGEQMLPSICRIFPRSLNMLVGDVKELNVRLACEATARLLTEMTEPIQFDVVEDHPTPTQAAYVLRDNMKDKNPLLTHYWSIKALGIGVLQNRFYSFPDRVLYLGTILGRLVEYETNGRMSEVEALLQGLMQQEDSETLRASLNRLPVDSAAAVPMRLQLANLKGCKGYEELLERAINAIGHFDGEQDRVTVNGDKYLEARKNFEAFCQKYPHILENIAVQMFHALAMPFGGMGVGLRSDQKLDIWRNYMFFCWRISIIQCILTCLVTPETPLDEVALMISIIARTFPNREEGIVMRVQSMEEMGLTSVDRLSVLLKG